MCFLVTQSLRTADTVYSTLNSSLTGWRRNGYTLEIPGATPSLMVIVTINGPGDLNFNPGRRCLCFTSCYCPQKRHESISNPVLGIK